MCLVMANKEKKECVSKYWVECVFADADAAEEPGPGGRDRAGTTG